MISEVKSDSVCLKYTTNQLQKVKTVSVNKSLLLVIAISSSDTLDKVYNKLKPPNGSASVKKTKDPALRGIKLHLYI